MYQANSGWMEQMKYLPLWQNHILEVCVFSIVFCDHNRLGWKGEKGMGWSALGWSAARPVNKPLGAFAVFLIRRTPVIMWHVYYFFSSSSSKSGCEGAYFKDPLPQKSKSNQKLDFLYLSYIFFMWTTVFVLQVSENARDITNSDFFSYHSIFSGQLQVKTQLQSCFKREQNIMCPQQRSYFFPILFMNSPCSIY